VPELLALRREGPVCVLRLARERKLNAISRALERELCEALATAEVREAGAIVLCGSERAFSAGADTGELGGSPAEIAAYYASTGDFVERVADLAQPTLSAIAGWCLGGGLELALATDFRIAEQGATFGLPEVGLGILPSSGGTYRLVRALGPARAKELILLRERIDAAEAYRLGLVTEVVGRGQALERALEHARRLAALPGLAAQICKRTIDVASESSRAAVLELERLAYGLLAQTLPEGGGTQTLPEGGGT
jgi:enoyl-CoA hydratase/carnithine racemase